MYVQQGKGGRPASEERYAGPFTPRTRAYLGRACHESFFVRDYQWSFRKVGLPRAGGCPPAFLFVYN